MHLRHPRPGLGSGTDARMRVLKLLCTLWSNCRFSFPEGFPEPLLVDATALSCLGFPNRLLSVVMYARNSFTTKNPFVASYPRSERYVSNMPRSSAVKQVVQYSCVASRMFQHSGCCPPSSPGQGSLRPGARGGSTNSLGTRKPLAHSPALVPFEQAEPAASVRRDARGSPQPRQLQRSGRRPPE
eukprot:scaffold593_cov382-Prasinococcus_capsulatus_cf.AAC.31